MDSIKSLPSTRRTDSLSKVETAHTDHKPEKTATPLIFEGQACKNPGVLKIILDDLASKASSDELIATHLHNAHVGTYMNYLAARINNFGEVFNENVQRILHDKGMHFVKIVGNTVQFETNNPTFQLIFKDGICTNPELLKTIRTDLTSKMATDDLIAKHISNAYTGGYMEYLNARIKNIGDAINRNVERQLHDQGIHVIKLEDGSIALGGYGVMPDRFMMIRESLPGLGDEVVGLISGYDGVLMVDKSEAYMCRVLIEGTPAEKSLVFAAASEACDIARLDAIIAKQVIPFLRQTQGNAWRLNLCGVDFTGLQILGLHMPRVDLSGAIFKGAMVGAMDFTQAKCWNTDFSGADLSYAKFGGGPPVKKDSRLSGAVFNGAKLCGANLVDQDLTAGLHDADVTGANLRGARVSHNTRVIVHGIRVSAKIMRNWYPEKPIKLEGLEVRYLLEPLHHNFDSGPSTERPEETFERGTHTRS
ncbi:hypothetical protein AAKU67_002418 [Oxalobacteraceae bacterium GrIS 2.11]